MQATNLNLTYIEKQKSKFIEELRNEGSVWGESPRNAVSAYFPEEYNEEIPEGGHWIMVTQPPHTEYTVKKFSIWYALNDAGKTRHDFPLFPIRYAKIKTPKGELRLYPWEYSKIDLSKYADVIGTEHLKLVFMSENPTLEKETAEKIYYIRTRGISKLEAYKLILGELKDPNLCYLEFHQAYIDMFTR